MNANEHNWTYMKTTERSETKFLNVLKKLMWMSKIVTNDITNINILNFLKIFLNIPIIW